VEKPKKPHPKEKRNAWGARKGNVAFCEKEKEKVEKATKKTRKTRSSSSGVKIEERRKKSSGMGQRMV